MRHAGLRARAARLSLFALLSLVLAARPAVAAFDLAAVRAMATADDLEKHQTAERLLKRHLTREPRDVPARLVLAHLLVTEGKTGDARRAFRQALRVDPSVYEAHREIGLLWQREWARFFDRKLLQRAIDELARGVPPEGARITADDWHGLATLGLLLSEAGVTDRAVQLLEPRVRAAGDSASAWARLSLAAAYQGAGRLSDAAAEYEAGIRHLGPLDRDGYSDVRPVAFEADREALSHLSIESRPAWLRVFWAAHDPTPTTPINEFQLEFYRRVTCAFSYFRLPGARWWDARGDVYVRFGPPDVVDTIEGHLIDATHDFETMDVILPDQVVWKYGQYDMDVRLAETNFNGLYTFPFPTRSVTTNPYLMEHVGPYAARKAFEHAETGWDPASAWLARGAHIREDRAQAILDHGGFVVRIELSKQVVALATAHAAFAGEGGGVREDVAIGALQRSMKAARPRPREIPRAALADTAVWGELAPAPAAPREIIPLTATAVLYDAAWRQVARAETRGPFATVPTAEGAMTVARLSLTAPPGHYYLATALEDSSIVGAHREGVRAPDFPSGFAISEVELGLPGGGAPQAAFGPSVAVANPSRTVGRGQTLAIYFEAYNLARDIRGRSRVAVRSTIRPLEGADRPLPGRLRRAGGIVARKPAPDVISTQFQDEARSSTLQRSFEVNVDGLDPGEYEVALTVTDLGTGLDATEKTTFRKSSAAPR